MIWAMGRGSRQHSDASASVRDTLDARRGSGQRSLWQAAAVSDSELRAIVDAIVESQDAFSRHVTLTASSGRLRRGIDGRAKGTPYVWVAWRTEPGSDNASDGDQWLGDLLAARPLTADAFRLHRRGQRHDEYRARVYAA